MHQLFLVDMPATLALAQRTTTGGEAVPTAPAGAEGAPGGAGPQPAGGVEPFFIIIMMMMVLMIVMTVMSGRKQRKQKKQMMESLRRNDRVQTIGGVIGTVIEIKDSEVLVETDRTSGTRVRFSKAAVQQVIQSSGGGGDAAEPVEPRIEPQP